MANKYMKTCSTLLTIKGMQIKVTQKFHFTPVRIAIIKNKTTTNAGEDAVKQESLFSVRRDDN
jgi:hypothetical protein